MYQLIRFITQFPMTDTVSVLIRNCQKNRPRVTVIICSTFYNENPCKHLFTITFRFLIHIVQKRSLQKFSRHDLPWSVDYFEVYLEVQCPVRDQSCAHCPHSFYGYNNSPVHVSINRKIKRQKKPSIRVLDAEPEIARAVSDVSI